MLKLLDDYGQTNWATRVKQLLFTNGFGYVWLNQRVPQPNTFISALVQRLRDQSIQSWNSEITDSSKLCLYKNFKPNYEHEAYLSHLSIRKFRNAFSKFRSCCQSLEIELGRHFGHPKQECICRLCNDGVVDELHFLLQCPVYETLRQKYIISKYDVIPSINKFNILLSSSSGHIIQAVASYLYNAFELRKELLDYISIGLHCSKYYYGTLPHLCIFYVISLFVCCNRVMGW